MRKITCTLLLIMPLLYGCSNPSSPALPEGYLAANIRLFSPSHDDRPETADVSADASSADTTVTLPQDSLLLRSIRRSEIMDSLQSMKIAFRTSYIGYHTKKELAGKSGDEVLAECERQFASAPERLSSSQYYTLVRQCIAGFRDGHLSIRTSIPQSVVGTGIGDIVQAEGRYYIATVRPNLLKKFEEIGGLTEGSLSQKIKPGFELLKFNNTDVGVEVQRFKNMITGSSELARERLAVFYFFWRQFDYPQSTTVTLLLKDPDQSELHEVTMPWVQLLWSARSASIETRQILSHNGFRRLFDLGDPENLLDSTGYTLGVSIFKDLQNKQVYVNKENDEDILIETGIAQLNNQTVCYLKLNTFSIDASDSGSYTVKKKSPTGNTEADAYEVIRSHLSACEAFNAPLVYDLRYNGGGDAVLADKIFRLFERNNDPKLYLASSMLTEPGNISVLINSLNPADSTKADIETQLELESVNQALQSNRSLTDWVVTYPLKSTRNVFSQKVLVLIGPDCVSACENTAAKLKNSGRATLIGEPTHGTGFGFSRSGNGATAFSDPLQFFTIQIPNRAFQSVVIVDDSAFRADEDARASILPLAQIAFMENRPTAPHINLALTVNDLKSEGANPDYLRRLGEILSAPQEGAGPTP